ncbi:Rpn family recombination-promoting nuclease/putative transposase [Marinospirillum alkaliphilum]|uniref:Transposase (putative) YhgA-like domain-containing protein n=1 Tax=Marinospirillum alkaliphilum DSM 21637 TaxID=1122209 RepID=A0A1K1V7Z3_9GAMM|nr:Rpn family recombination-promoting nuclease/putative transposase [Marinospirillum alkaliphilum]SFX20884.1 conserved hypothetical protein (putative transposase or invertase) [Marinospirillum alkaliphilum DSM 21637]
MSRYHDKAYKELFSYPEFVQQLMEGFAPPEISCRLDFSTLENLPGNYITPLMDERFEDVVWSVQFKPEVGEQTPATLYLCILLEFQSSIDRTMPLRMLHYVAAFYHQLLKHKRASLKEGLPLVFPVVLYNGSRPWNAAEEMQTLLQPVPAYLKSYQPQLRYYLVDESRYTTEELEQRNTPLSSLFTIENSHSPEALQQSVQRLVSVLQQHPDKQRLDKLLLRWFKQHLHNRKVRVNLEPLTSLMEAPDMLAENLERMVKEWKQKGYEQGMAEGIAEGVEKGIEQGIEKGIATARTQMASRLLQRGLSDAEVAELLELDLQQVQTIKAQQLH